MTEIAKTAVISECGLYRYRLTRRWGHGTMLPFIMLNPSTADADNDDPTIRKCMKFARRSGCSGIVVANLFAFRATEPKVMLRAASPFGPDNEWHLTKLAREAIDSHLPVVCAWGTQGGAGVAVVLSILGPIGRERPELVCLGKTKDGHPRHPLYVRDDKELDEYP